MDIFTRYDQQGASSRLRYYLYRDYFVQSGLDPHFFPFFDQQYLQRLYSKQGKSLAALFQGWQKRRSELKTADDLLLIEYELFPFWPYAVERRWLRKRRYVLNFDDWVWEKYRHIPMLQRKYDQLIARASGVIVANHKLQEYVSRINSHCLQVPTVIDLRAYSQTLPKYDKFTVVWIGTPVTYRYLQHFAERFQKLARQVDFELLTIASKDLPPLPGVQQRRINWSPEIEAEALNRSHVGIMPLTDDIFSQGKSAYKLIQFMGAGIPAIASPVGENCRVLRPGETGFLAAGDDAWLDALKQLAQNENLRHRMGETARKCAQEYSLQKYGPILTDFIQNC